MQRTLEIGFFYFIKKRNRVITNIFYKYDVVRGNFGFQKLYHMKGEYYGELIYYIYIGFNS